MEFVINNVKVINNCRPAEIKFLRVSLEFICFGLNFCTSIFALIIFKLVIFLTALYFSMCLV